MTESEIPEAGDINPEETFELLDKSITMAIQMLKEGKSNDEIFLQLTLLADEVKESIVRRAQTLIETRQEGSYLDNKDNSQE